MSFMTKEHSKEIMTRSRLRKNFQKNESISILRSA